MAAEPRELAYDDRGDVADSETVPSPTSRRLWDDDAPPRRDLNVFGFIDEKFGGPPPKRQEARLDDLDHNDADLDDVSGSSRTPEGSQAATDRPVELDENGQPKKRRRRRRRGGRGSRGRNGAERAPNDRSGDDAGYDDDEPTSRADDADALDGDPSDIDPRNIDPRNVAPRKSVARDVDPRDIDPRDLPPRRERSPRMEGQTDEPRRKRRRRGGRKTSAGTAPVAPVANLQDELHEDLHEALDMTRGPIAEDDASGERQMHREVVPWKEAIGILIGINMEARAKSPRGGNDYRRGGPRRGNHDRR
ncbi:MAG: hypothetical protein QM811_10005 [Pirellulales bacterium]